MITDFDFIMLDASKASPYQLGMLGEDYAQYLFEQSGLTVFRNGAHSNKNGDMRVLDTETGIVTRIEVKTARIGVSGRFHLCLSRTLPDRECTNTNHADFVVIILVASKAEIPQVLYIPAKHFSGKKSLTLPKDVSTSKTYSKFVTHNLGKEARNVY